MEDLKFWTKKKKGHGLIFCAEYLGEDVRVIEWKWRKGKVDTNNMEQRTEALEKTKTGTTSVALSLEKK